MKPIAACIIPPMLGNRVQRRMDQIPHRRPSLRDGETPEAILASDQPVQTADSRIAGTVTGSIESRPKPAESVHPHSNVDTPPGMVVDGSRLFGRDRNRRFFVPFNSSRSAALASAHAPPLESPGARASVRRKTGTMFNLPVRTSAPLFALARGNK